MFVNYADVCDAPGDQEKLSKNMLFPLHNNKKMSGAEESDLIRNQLEEQKYIFDEKNVREISHHCCQLFVAS